MLQQRGALAHARTRTRIAARSEGSGANKLFGERGNDRLVAGESGGSRLDGGSGNDRVDAVNGRKDTVNCGNGYDRATLDRRDKAQNCERLTRKRT